MPAPRTYRTGSEFRRPRVTQSVAVPGRGFPPCHARRCHSFRRSFRSPCAGPQGYAMLTVRVCAAGPHSCSVPPSASPLSIPLACDTVCHPSNGVPGVGSDQRTTTEAAWPEPAGIRLYRLLDGTTVTHTRVLNLYGQPIHIEPDALASTAACCMPDSWSSPTLSEHSGRPTMGAGMRSAARTPPPFLISAVGPWGNRPYSAASPPCVRACNVHQQLMHRVTCIKHCQLQGCDIFNNVNPISSATK
jgi:hypothetical protein